MTSEVPCALIPECQRPTVRTPMDTAMGRMCIACLLSKGSACEEGNKLRDDLIRRLIPEPMAGTLDDDALDLVVDQAPLLNEKFAGCLLAGQHQHRHRQLGLGE